MGWRYDETSSIGVWEPREGSEDYRMDVYWPGTTAPQNFWAGTTQQQTVLPPPEIDYTDVPHPSRNAEVVWVAIIAIALEAVFLGVIGGIIALLAWLF